LKARDAFVGDVATFLQKSETEELGTEAVVKVITRLGEWTRKHIRAMDQEFDKFLKEEEWLGAEWMEPFLN
jgi:hemerythrin